jgi:hypothetical protein
MNTTATINSQIDTNVEATTRSSRILRPGLVAGLVAAAVNTAVVAVAAAADVSRVVERGGRPIPAAGFAQVTFACALIGVGLAAILRRRSARPAVMFTRITVALTAASMVPPFLVHADPSTKVLLLATHLIAAAIIIPVLAKRLAR